MNEFDDKIERYITKLDSHPKFLFLKYFRLPKNLPLFTISTTVIFSEIELLAHIWIPSLLAIYLIWECLVSFLEKEEIAFQCSVEESVFDDQCLEGDPMFENMFPGEPMRVTEEDRDFILLTRVLNFRNMTFMEKVKKYYWSIYFATLIYSSGYLILRFLHSL